MHLRLPPVLVAFFAAFTLSAFAAPPSVEELVVGPSNQGGIYTLSPDGGRIAYATMKGVKAVVTIDGVEGPVVDELFGPTGQSFFNPQTVSIMPSSPGGQNALSPMMPVIFSPDGAHYAYAARIGSEYIVIHDGKEIARGPRADLSLNYGPLTLSPTGRHVYWDEMKSDASRGRWRLMMSGKPGPWSGHQTMKPVFDAEDSHYAYNAGKVDNYQEQMLVVDGKDAGYSGLTPQFTADGKILLSVRPAPNVAVLADGKPVLTGISVDQLVVAPVGRRWGAIVRTKVVNGLGVGSFFLDGKEVSGTEGAQSITFSADGKHYAVVCTNPTTRTAFMVIDGKAGTEFQSVSDKPVYWTADYSKVAYTAVTGGRNFLVVNDEVSPINSLLGHTPFVTSKSGGHYGYGTNDGMNRTFTLVIDGKPVLLPNVYPVGDTLTLSPDGTRYAYFFGPVGRSDLSGFAVDGVAVEGLAPVYFAKWRQTELAQPSFIFSPNSKHVAYLSRRGADAKTQGIYVDGKFAFAGQRAMYFPTFTPDSRHLFWAVSEFAAGKPPALTVYADGREAVRANGLFFANSAGAWTMDDKGTVTYFAADGDRVKRYRIKAAADSSLDTMIADLAAVQDKELADAEAARKAAADAAAKAKADKEAADAKAKADRDAATEAKNKARQEALDARKEAAAAKAKAREDAVKAKQSGK